MSVVGASFLGGAVLAQQKKTGESEKDSTPFNLQPPSTLKASLSK